MASSTLNRHRCRPLAGDHVGAFMWLLAAWSIVSGTLILAAAGRLARNHGRWWLGLGGIVSVLYEFLLIIAPLIGALVLTWWLGAYALLYGGFLLVLAFKLRARKNARGPPFRIQRNLSRQPRARRRLAGSNADGRQGAGAPHAYTTDDATLLEDAMADAAPLYADKFVHSLAVRDFASLGGTFAPEVQFRGLVPAGLREAGRPRRRATTISSGSQTCNVSRWSGIRSCPLLTTAYTSPTGFTLFKKRGQSSSSSGFLSRPNGIEKFDLVCSGFLPRRE
jgi:hypothetical protein